MDTTTARQCIITLSLISIGLPTQAQATAASVSGPAASAPGEIHEKSKPAAPGTANRRGAPPAGKPREIAVVPDRAQEVEELVLSGQMEPPIAQNEISEQLEQLHNGSNDFPGEIASGQGMR